MADRARWVAVEDASAHRTVYLNPAHVMSVRITSALDTAVMLSDGSTLIAEGRAEDLVNALEGEATA